MIFLLKCILLCETAFLSPQIVLLMLVDYWKCSLFLNSLEGIILITTAMSKMLVPCDLLPGACNRYSEISFCFALVMGFPLLIE